MLRVPVVIRLVSVQIMAYLSISIEHIFDVTARKLIQLLVAGKHNHGDLRTTQHGKLEGLLEKAILALEKCHLFMISEGSQRRLLPLDCDHP